MAQFTRTAHYSLLAPQELGYLGLSYASATDLGNCACACSTWLEATLVDINWENIFRVEFGLDNLVDINGNICSARVAYLSWRNWHNGLGELCLTDGSKKIFPKKNAAEIYHRIFKCFQKLDLFYQNNLPHVYESLNPGISFEKWDLFQNELMVDIFNRYDDDEEGRPLYGLQILRMILSIHNGQSDFPSFNGMFGGFSVYDHVVCSHFLSAETMLAIAGRRPPKYRIPIAWNNVPDASNTRLIYYDLETGYIHDHFRKRLVHSHNDKHDDLLQWFECLSDRIMNHIYVPAPILTSYPNESYGLCLFPKQTIESKTGDSKYGFHTRAVTLGVEVEASVIYLFEASYQWTYSISIRILPPDHPEYLSVEARGFETCQLKSRHWDVEDSRNGTHNHVQGEGVVGFFPRFRDQGYIAETNDIQDDIQDEDRKWIEEGRFTYSSLTGSLSVGSSFGGEFTFVPGSIASPTGENFNVNIPRFSLDIPNITF